MADSFSFNDRVYAVFASCLSAVPCLPGSSTGGEVQLSNDNERDSDTLSLHSNFTRRNQTRVPSTNITKRITLFGWDLFGRGIQLPESDEEDDGGVSLFGSSSNRKNRRGNHRRNTAASGTETTSSFTLDSDADAAPLDASLIDIRAAERVEEEARALQHKKQEKEERRRLRRERKELKRLALAGSFNDNATGEEFDTFQHGSTGEFEGFPGSGEGTAYPGLPQFTPSPTPSLQFHPPPTPSTHHEDEDDADLDGAMYNSRPRHTGLGGSGSGSQSRTSDSRSRSASDYRSQPDRESQYAHFLPGQQQPLPTPPLSYASHDTSGNPSSKHNRSKSKSKSKSKKKSSALSSSTNTASTTSTSTSLPSPSSTPPGFVTPAPAIALSSAQGEQEDDYESRFPSVGFGGGTPKFERKDSLKNQGAFLAGF